MLDIAKTIVIFAHWLKAHLRSLARRVGAQLNFLQGASFFPATGFVPLTFVTASDISHAKSLYNLLSSITAATPDAEIIVFDLGMSHQDLLSLKEAFPLVKLERFPYEEFPKYFDIRVDAGQYAWKAQCVERVATVSEGDLFWIDAGCIVTGPLKRARRVLNRRGIFANRAAGPSSRWTHPLTFAALNAGADGFKRDQLAATFVGFRVGMPKIDRLIADWANYSRDEMVIAPPGSSRANHRQDQSILSILIYGLLAESTPKVLLNIVGYWTTGVSEYLVHQDVD